MGKALIISEKPSVAADIAKALGGFAKHGDYYEREDFVLTSAIGHLLELCVPEEFEKKGAKWSFKSLPIIPPRFSLQPIEKTKDRLKLLSKLIARKDVDRLINACDAGREGELIFRYIVQHTGSLKPVQRLWLQSMTPSAIREGFASLRDDAAMQPLANAAICRSEADWLVGINSTRAMTAFNSKKGKFQLTTVGRVQTPTLAVVVEREERIKKFIPRNYWEVFGTFTAAAGPYIGRWFDEHFSKASTADHPELKPERIWEESKAEAIRAKCLGQPGVVTEESKPSSQLSPLLFDLTSLQREANNRFSFSARRTLQLAQSLYERHKLLTYPRTDSRALPEDYLGATRNVLETLSQTPFQPFARQILQQNWVHPNKRIFNNAKVSDHFAIIPTPAPPKPLSEEETKIYEMVVKRFLAVFYPAAEYLVTTRVTRVLDEPFKTEGKVLVRPGWLAVYGRTANQESGADLVPITPNETVQTTEIEVRPQQTKPPPRFTEATLLSAMESAGKSIEDEELREAMRAKGLGTPATRAAIIEGLLTEKYLLRQARELVPTAKAFALMSLLRALEITELSSPELTGDWEYKLKQMEQSHLQRGEFMSQIADMTRRIVDRSREYYQQDSAPGDFGALSLPCPKCGGQIKENYQSYECVQCGFAVRKYLAGRQIEPAEAESLIHDRQLGPLTGFVSRSGKPFSAILRLNEEFKTQFDFGENSASGDGNGAAPDFTGQEPVGVCPKCQGRIFEQGMVYICEKAVGPERTCTFRSGKVILQQEIPREQMRKLLATGKTDLLTRFISKKGRRFSARLAVGAEGKIGFEFEPRRPAAPKKKPAPAESQPPNP